MTRLPLAILLLTVLLQACGQTGPLYWPGAEPVEQPVAGDPTPDTEPDE